MGSIEVQTVPEAEKYAFRHLELGNIIGRRRGNDVVQFRGIPYASIPGRFRQSVLKHDLPSQPFWATNPGPACPQPHQPYFKYWQAPLPDDLPVLEAPGFDEFNCLNLSLTIPSRCLVAAEKKVPVLVFIHGGAFVNGSHSIQLSGREVFDGTGVVRHSITIRKAIIIVGINYRVGPLGFLASREISELNSGHQEDIGNYGLHDQRHALEWLSRFIAGFGGDPDNITIQGTSAGAASCHYLSTFPGRKFKRAIYASGTATGVGAMDISYHQEVYQNLLDTVAADVPRDQALERLISCNVTDLTHKVPWLLCHPLIDNSYIHQSSYAGSAHDEDLPDIMVGVTAFEEDFSNLLFTDLVTNVLKSDEQIMEQIRSAVAFNHSFDLANTDAFTSRFQDILEAYNVHDKITSPSAYLQDFCHLLGNIMFDAPSLYVALASQMSRGKGRVWLYHYGITNQYPASHSYRKAHHGVNDLLLFNPAPEMIPSEERDSWDSGVAQTQRSWIEFANGESPWSPVRKDSSVAAVPHLGPIFRFEDHGKSREFHTLKDCVSSDQAYQYESILRASRLVR